MRAFKTESKKLLDLMINSIYTNREIFLRELISNASDALDKRRFTSLTNASAQTDPDQLAITLTVDKTQRTITVSDNGIGMTEAELEKNLGTIAHSGSEEFKKSIAQQTAEPQGAEEAKNSAAQQTDNKGASAPDAADIIGRFGVGFYSSFMVAKYVQVITRPLASDDCLKWTSDGLEGYTIEQVAKSSPEYRTSAGTDIILTLKDNLDDENYDEYLSEYSIRELVRRYSNYLRYPVQMLVEKTRLKPQPQTKKDKDATDPSTNATAEPNAESTAESTAEPNADKNAQPEYETYTELDTLNSMTPIWKKRASEVGDEDYAEFYKASFHDWNDPLSHFSLHAEGTLEYDALLFIPKKAPFDLYSSDYEKGLELYSSNVLIMEKCADLLPDYYNFVRGVVDSEDVSLNISRETLQQTRQLQAMARFIEKKITTELERLRDQEREKYESFFDAFGRTLKFGIYQSFGAKKDQLQDLLLFLSARENKLITLKEYVDAASEDQKEIYFAAGDDKDRLAKMPAVKNVLDKGYDVLLCTQDVDEFCLTTIQSYQDHELKNVTSSDLDLASEEEKASAQQSSKDNKDLLESLASALDSKVSQVRISAHLHGAPAVLVAEGPISLEMEKVLSAGPNGNTAPKAQRVLELNKDHAVFEKLQKSFADKDEKTLALYADLLYNQALLVEGMMPEDPVAFASNICELM